MRLELPVSLLPVTPHSSKEPSTPGSSSSTPTQQRIPCSLGSAPTAPQTPSLPVVLAATHRPGQNLERSLGPSPAPPAPVRGPSAFGTRPPRGPSFPSPPQVPARHLQHRPGVAPATWPSCRLTPGCWGENSTGSDATEQEPQTGVKSQEEIQCHGEQTKRARILWCVCSECQLRPSSERSMVARSLFILTVMQLSYRSTMRHLTLKITIFKSKIQKAPPLSNRV